MDGRLLAAARAWRQVARELVRRNIIPDFAVLRRLVQEVAHQAMKVLMRSGDVLALMQKRR